MLNEKQYHSVEESKNSEAVIIGEGELSIDDVVSVAKHNRKVRLTNDPTILLRMQASYDYITRAVSERQLIYGVNTGFGGMSNIQIQADECIELQNNLLSFLKAGAGRILAASAVRAGMLLRANSLVQGCSAVRIELVERLICFLNSGVTPIVYDLGSIGASGDLVPLAAIAGAITGRDKCFRVNFCGDEIDSITALERLGMQPLQLAPKEGLALVNGTSAMAGIAVNCVHDARLVFSLALCTHTLMIVGLGARVGAFDAFIHQCKAFPGQIWVAAMMRELIGDSPAKNSMHNLDSEGQRRRLCQERYSIRCLPQYLGPIADGLKQIAWQMQIEANSITDNPLINIDDESIHNGGNFLGQYVGIGMDQLRSYMALMAKHLDVQIAMLVMPEFSNGLPPSLIGNGERRSNMGLKALQLTGNSIMPHICFLGNSFVDRFPTHAEQFNQNISSLGFGSANLAQQSLELCNTYMAVALLFGIQAVDLRSYLAIGHYDGRKILSPSMCHLYEAILKTLNLNYWETKPFIQNDNEQSLEEYIRQISRDIAGGGYIPQSVAHVVANFKKL